MTRGFLRQGRGSAFGLRLLLASILAAAGDLYAQKIWTNPGSGSWADTNNWSGHSAPTDTSAVLITNANTKTVTIDGNTPSGDLTVASLKISGPSGSTNTLL